MSTSMSWRDAIDAPRRRTSWIDRYCRRVVLRMLSKIAEGRLVLEEPSETHVFGSVTTDFPVAARISVRSDGLYRRIVFGGHISVARSYADGLWSCDDLPALIRIFVRRFDVLDSTDRGLARLIEPLNRAYHWLRRNSLDGSRRNIAAHYDLGNDFFELFLDDTMTYSAGIFETPSTTMRDASIAKLDRICRKLRLGPNDHVLEIGTGWGSFAIHAARHYGCRVTTTTISQEQHDLAQRRIEAAGVAPLVQVLRKDYRQLEGRFDKIVSIEMIEAVGHQYFDTFFRKCASLLRPDGQMALQAITIADQRYETARRTVDFIKREIFPGSCIPSVERLCRSVATSTDLRVTHLEDITPHYATTLQRWRDTMHHNIDAVRALGYTERFIRMWEFYLAYCEGGFAERYIGTVQMVLSKPHNRSRPILPSIEDAASGTSA